MPGQGEEIDKMKAKHYYELAAMNGSVYARHNIRCMESDDGKYQRSIKHWVIGAKEGYEVS